MTRLRDRFTAWISNELSTEAGLDRELATRIGERVVAAAQPTAAAVSHLGPGTAVANGYVSLAASAVTCARATAHCPGQKDWWRGPGARVLELLLAGDAWAAEARQAEMLAGDYDYDFDFDPNWPESKMFRVLEVPEDLPLGSLLIGSDEHGMRVSLKSWSGKGVRGLQLTRAPVKHPTADLETGTR